MTNWLITSHWKFFSDNFNMPYFLTAMGQMIRVVVESENCSPLSHKPRWCHARQTRQDLRSIFNQSVQALKQMCTQAAILSAMHICSKSGTQIIKKKVTHEHLFGILMSTFLSRQACLIYFKISKTRKYLVPDTKQTPVFPIKLIFSQPVTLNSEW